MTKNRSSFSVSAPETYPKQDDQEEDLKEGAEDVGVAAEEKDEGDEGGEATIQYCRAHIHLGSRSRSRSRMIILPLPLELSVFWCRTLSGRRGRCEL